MYQLLADKVNYNGKKLPCDPDSFEVLIYEFARDAHGVFYKGVRQPKLEASSFQVLDEFYARDGGHVYLFSERKVKTISADVDSFRPAGFGFAKDQKGAFWLDKRIKADAESLFPFAEGLAWASNGVFLENKKIHKKAISPNGLRARRFQRTVYFFNPEGAWISEYEWEAQPLLGVDVESLGFLNGDYVYDHRQLYYAGKAVAELQGQEPRFLDQGEQLLALGRQRVFYRGRPLLEADLETLCLVDYYPVDQHGVFDVSGERLARFLETTGVDAHAAVTRVVHRQWQLLSGRSALGDAQHLSDAQPPIVEGLQVCLQGAEIVLSLAGHSVRGGWDQVPWLVSRLWSLVVYGSPFVRFLHTTHTMYPEGDLQVEESLASGGPEFVAAAKLHDPASLPVLARQVVASVYGDKREPFFRHLTYASLAACSPELEASQVTTNLARARQIVERGEITSASPMVRHRAAHALYGLVVASDKTDKMLSEVGPVVSRQAEDENEFDLKWQWLAVLDLLAANVFLMADRGAAPLLAPLDTLCQLLVRHQFNLDLNLARVWEISRFQGRPADDLWAALTTLVRDHPMSPLWSGLNLGFPSLWAWRMAADLRWIRTLGSSEKPEALKCFVSAFRQGIKTCQDPWIIGDLLLQLEEVAEDFAPLHLPPLEWPQDRFYLRMDSIEYLLKKAPLREAAAQATENGIQITGWPWGRLVKIDTGSEQIDGFVGQLVAWPGTPAQGLSVSAVEFDHSQT